MVFRFVVSSQTVKDYIDKNIFHSLEGFLMNKLRNSQIKLQFALEGEVETQQGLPYTSKEKYMYMLEKNPDLQLLQKAFDLETD